MWEQVSGVLGGVEEEGERGCVCVCMCVEQSPSSEAEGVVRINCF